MSTIPEWDLLWHSTTLVCMNEEGSGLWCKLFIFSFVIFCIEVHFSHIHPSFACTDVDYKNSRCVVDCKEGNGPLCGGVASPLSEDLYQEPKECCEDHLGWVKPEFCEVRELCDLVLNICVCMY